MVGKLIQEGIPDLKIIMEDLLQGKSFHTTIDEQIIFNQLDHNIKAIWSLLLASGYLKALSHESYIDIPEGVQPKYELTITNLEVKLMFQSMVRDWFKEAETDYSDFIKALLLGDIRAMNTYMNKVALEMFSCFDSGTKPSEKEPERFYNRIEETILYPQCSFRQSRKGERICKSTSWL